MSGQLTESLPWRGEENTRKALSGCEPRIPNIEAASDKLPVGTSPPLRTRSILATRSVGGLPLCPRKIRFCNAGCRSPPRWVFFVSPTIGLFCWNGTDSNALTLWTREATLVLEARGAWRRDIVLRCSPAQSLADGPKRRKECMYQTRSYSAPRIAQTWTNADQSDD
ncbi:hypothetical protein LZ30DRAFT_51903 [Colletotrichum cereale]|nr:hypothetical protein LZ30DRAFT_51903 [Colletotrichum cereale]